MFFAMDTVVFCNLVATKFPFFPKCLIYMYDLYTPRPFIPLICACLFFLILLEVQKVLSAIAKERGGEVLSVWIRPCVNHLHWSATSTVCGTGRIIWAKFKSFMSHIINKHTGLDEPLFSKCAHGEIRHRRWLLQGTAVHTFITILVL